MSDNSEEIRRLHAVRGALERRLAAAEANVKALSKAASERHERLEILSHSLESTLAELSALAQAEVGLERRVRALSAHARRQQVELEERQREILRLRNHVAELEPLLLLSQEQEARLRTLEVQHERSMREKDAVIAGLRRRRDRRGTAGPAEGADDLKRVRGIGPVLERRLNDLGITTYRQIATWTDEDIEHLGKGLGVFRDRIRRDGWIRNARSEHLRKYGESP